MADGTVTIAIDLDGSDAESGFKRLKSLIGGTGDSAKKTGGLFKTMLGANIIGSAITKSISAIGSGIRSMADELNSSKKAWDTFEGNMRMLGNSDAEIGRAKKAMQDYATQTIYSASDMASTYSQLAAVGVDNVDQLVTGFGGLAASAENPAQAMKSLSMQATQMAAKPKVAWQDFKIMMEQSPAGMAAVAKEMGMSLEDMIGKIQDGELATNDFFNAVKKVGNNDHFSKMATQFKTVDQAMDGLKESLANKLQPAFGKLSEYGIKAIEKISDVLDKLDFSGLEAWIDKVAKGFQDFFSGLGKSGVLQSLKASLSSVGSALKHLFGSIAGDGKVSFETLGESIGEFVKWVSDGVNKVAEFVSKLNPSTIQTFAKGILGAVLAFKGFKMISRIAGLFSSFGKIGNKAMSGIGGSAKRSGSLIVNVFKGLGKFIESFAKGFATAFKSVTTGISTLAKGLATAFSTAFKGFSSGLSTIFQGVARAISIIPVSKMLAFGAAALLVAAGIALIATQGEGLAKIFVGIGDMLATVISAISDGISTIIGAIADGLVTITPFIAQVGQSVSLVIQTIGQAIATAAPGIEAFGLALKLFFEGLGTALEGLGNGIQAVLAGIGSALQGLGSLIEGALNGVADVISSVGSAIQAILSGLGEAFVGFGQGVQSVLDGVANVVSSVGDAISSALSALGSAFESAGTGIKTAMEGVSTAVETAGAAIEGVLTALSTAFETAGTAIEGVLEAIKGIIDEVGDTAKEIAEAFQIMSDALVNLSGVDLLGIGAGLAAIAAALTTINLTGNIGGTSEGMTALSTALGDMPDISTLGDDFTSMKEGLTDLGTEASSAGTGLTELKESVDGFDTLSSVAENTGTLKSSLTGLGLQGILAGVGLIGFKQTVTTLAPALQTAITSLTSFGTAFSSTKTAISSSLMAINNSVTSSLNNVKMTFTTTYNLLKSSTITSMNAIKTTVTSSMNNIKSITTSTLNAIRSLLTHSMNAMRSSVSSSFNAMVSTVSSAMNRMLAIMSSAGSTGVGIMRSAGWQIGNGLAQGMYSALGAVTAAANALVAQALRAARAKAMIHSPSRLFSREVGRYLPQGVGVGIEKNMHYATDSVENMIDSLAKYQVNTSDIIGVGKSKLSQQLNLQASLGGSGVGASQNNNTYNQSYTLNANGEGSSDFFTPENMQRLVRELAYYTRLEGGRV